MSDTPWRKWHSAILLAIMVVAVLARLHGITTESPWNDEALTLRHVGAPSFEAYLKGVFEEDPWLILSQGYYWLQYGWASIFGPSTLSIRLLSVALSVLCVPLIAALGSIISNPPAALIACALYALSLVQVYYGQETRFYALLNLEALLSMLGLALAIYRHRASGWFLHALGNTALLMTHAFTPLLFAAQGTFLLWHWRRTPLRLVIWTSAHFALLLAFFLWTKYGISYDFADKTQAYNDVQPTWRELLMTYVVFAGGRFSNEDPAQYMFSLDWPVTLLILAIAGWGSMYLLRLRHKSTGLLLAWLLIPVLLLFVASLFWRPVFQYRYVLPSAIPLALLAGVGWSVIGKSRWRTVLAALLFGTLTYQNLMLPRPMRPDFNAFERLATREAAPIPCTPVLAMKPFVARAAKLALPDCYEVLTLYGLDDLIYEITLRPEKGETIWALFHHWSKFQEFESRLDNLGCNFTRYECGGMPPLVAYRLEQQR